MSKRTNSMNEMNEAGPVMQASGSAVEDMPVAVTDDRETSYAQGDVAEKEEEEDGMEAGQDDIPAPTDASTLSPASPVDDPIRTAVLINPNATHSLNVEEVVADPAHNGRFKERTITDPSVKELAASIKAEGQLQAARVILMNDGMKRLVFGFGRYLAIKLINATRQPADHLPLLATVILEDPEDLARAGVQNGLENLKKLDLTPLDKMTLARQLLASGLTQKQIGERLGVAKAMVTSYLKIGKVMETSEFVKDALVNNLISPAAVYDLTVVDSEKVEATVKKLLVESGGKKVTVAEAQRKTREAKPAAKKGKAEKGEGKAGRPRAAAKQRTAKQILSFIDAEATIANDKKYEDKALSKKLECFAAYVKGGGEATFLKNLAGL